MVRRKKFSISRSLIYVLLTCISMICVLPMLLVLVVSFTEESCIGRYGYSLFPKKLSLAAYEKLFYPGSSIYASCGITIFVTVVGTAIAVLITFMVAYPLANKNLKYRNQFAMFFFFTTVFNSGMVPWYLICRKLGMYNNILSLLIPSMIFTPFNMFLVRNYVTTIPESLMESARLDGASETRIGFQIYFPLCKPIIATITLFYGINYWNNWFNAVMLIDNQKLYPLQMLLFRLQSDISMLSQMVTQGVILDTPPSESFKMATVIVTIGPLVFLYPFLQKYFVRGIMVGSVKG